MKEILKHFKIWLMLVRVNLMSQMEYRANFVTGVMMESGYLIAKIMYVAVAYAAGKRIAGFGPDEILVFVGTFVTLTGFYAGVFMMNYFQLPRMVRDGSFDAILTKPLSTQFYASFRRSDMGPYLLDTIAGIVMVCIGFARLGAFDVHGAAGILSLAGRAAGWAFYAASGGAVAYALWLLPMTLVFRIVRAEAIAGFTDSFWDFNNVPMIVYGKTGRAIGTFVIPMFVITNFPALFALGRMTPVQAIWGVVAPFIFVSLSSFVWNRGIRRYASGGN
jgi:ABC-2 type transport system permease protein